MVEMPVEKAAVATPAVVFPIKSLLVRSLFPILILL
jgi:hypothetical protein